MCGIVGVASSEGMKNRSARLQFMKVGLDIDSWRGWESTGMALVPEDPKDPTIVYKRALNGRDFIQLRKVEKYLDDIEKYPVVIGHNRAATTGRGNIVDHNAHPFQYGRITLVHNGHIRNTHELQGAVAGANCLVDSAHVAFAMNANGEKETLEQIEGGFCFVWWNSETGTLNIARNTERPLHMAFAAKENTFYFASELTELLHLLKDVPIDEEAGIMYPAAWSWYQFNLKNLREFTKTPFVKRQGRRNQTTILGAGRGSVGEDISTTEGWTDEELAQWDHLETRNTRQGRTSAQTFNDREEVEEIRETIANQRLKDVKLAGIPTSKKRIARAKQELKKLGIEYNSMKICTPGAWTKYKNQDSLGSVLARTKTGGHLVEVLQVRQEEYVEYYKANTLLVDCINVRNGPANDFRIVGIVSPRMKDYLDKRAQNLEAAGSIERAYDGPGGMKITLARFLELTHTGCANCRGDLHPKEHGALLWIAGSAICPECAGDPAVMELLGIPEHVRQDIVH